MQRKRIVILALALLTSVVWLALPALAQTDPAVPVVEEGPSTGDVLAALAVFGAMVKAALAILKRHAPNISGTVTQAVGWALGAGLAATLDYRAASALIEANNLTSVVGRLPAGPLDYVITGFGIMAASGIISEFVGTSGPRKAALEATARCGEVVEVGYDGKPV